MIAGNSGRLAGTARCVFRPANMFEAQSPDQSPDLSSAADCGDEVNFRVWQHFLIEPQSADFAIDRDTQTGSQIVVLKQSLLHTGELLLKRLNRFADGASFNADLLNVARETSQLRRDENCRHGGH